MRVLFMHHFPLDRGESGRQVDHWAGVLRQAGHEVRVLLVDSEDHAAHDACTERVVCRPDDAGADLKFALPEFGERKVTDGRSGFTTLTDPQLAEYRATLRRALDRIIDRFDPHVIHSQHIWVQGQLALETGVPYVLNAWGPEFVDYAADTRYRALAEQAAENAGRILVPGESLRQQVLNCFEVSADRVTIMPAAWQIHDAAEMPARGAQVAEGLSALYQAVLHERFGGPV